MLYCVDGTDEKLTLLELEGKSRRFADALRIKYDIKPNDVVAILAKDKVSERVCIYILPPRNVVFPPVAFDFDKPADNRDRFNIQWPILALSRLVRSFH